MQYHHELLQLLTSLLTTHTIVLDFGMFCHSPVICSKAFRGLKLIENSRNYLGISINLYANVARSKQMFQRKF